MENQNTDSIINYPHRDFFLRHQVNNGLPRDWIQRYYHEDDVFKFHNKDNSDVYRPESGTFKLILLNYDPNINPEMYRFLNNAMPQPSSLPPFWIEMLNNPEIAVFYTENIQPKNNMYKRYYEITDQNDIKHIYIQPPNHYHNDFTTNSEYRESLYLGKYDENLMGPIYEFSSPHLMSDLVDDQPPPPTAFGFDSTISQGGKKKENKTKKFRSKLIKGGGEVEDNMLFDVRIYANNKETLNQLLPSILYSS